MQNCRIFWHDDDAECSDAPALYAADADERITNWEGATDNRSGAASYHPSSTTTSNYHSGSIIGFLCNPHPTSHGIMQYQCPDGYNG